MKQISIVGFGRFGKTLYRLLKDDFAIMLFSRSEIDPNDTELTKSTVIAKDLSEVYKSDVIFYAVPISAFEQVIASHKKYFQANHVLIDVLSVKLHPAKVFDEYLADSNAQALLTHPMFGPDSSKNGFESLPMVLDKFRTTESTYNFWKEYFQSKKLRVIEMSAEEHDRIAANSQGLTHFIGRLLQEYKLKDSSIDSLGTKKLLEIREQTCNDTWQLFTDLQHYNPYTKQMRLKLGDAYDKLYNKLLPKQIDPGFITFGIQGGKGSFNEEVVTSYIEKNNVARYKIRYLYTSEKVLRNLHEGTIDYGLFATHNATGGIVHESIHAMARYKFKIVDELEMLVRHFLMKRKKVSFEDITTIMAHPQNFRQCTSTLSKKYPHLKLESGKGDLIDTAKAAFYLSSGKLPGTTAILGPLSLSQRYGLTIIGKDLQDRKDNVTNFLLVSR